MEYLTTFNKIPDDQSVECDRCQWSGVGRDLVLELFEEVVEVNCPSCDGRIQLLSLPTKQDVADEAALGNPVAMKMLAAFEGDSQ